MSTTPVVDHLRTADAEALGDFYRAHQQVHVDPSTHAPNLGRPDPLTVDGLRNVIRTIRLDLRIRTRRRRHVQNTLDFHNHHRQTASLLADAVVRNQFELLRLVRKLDADPDAIFGVANEIEDNRSLNCLRTSLDLAACLLQQDGIDLDEMMNEFLPATWVRLARRVLGSVSEVRSGALPVHRMIDDLLALRAELASS